MSVLGQENGSGRLPSPPRPPCHALTTALALPARPCVTGRVPALCFAALAKELGSVLDVLEREESDEQRYLLRSRGSQEKRRPGSGGVSPAPRQPCPPAKRQKSSATVAGRAGFSRGRCNSASSNSEVSEAIRCSSVASNPVSEPSEAHGDTGRDESGSGWLLGRGPSPVPQIPESRARMADVDVRQACANLDKAVGRQGTRGEGNAVTSDSACSRAIHIERAVAAADARSWPRLVGPTMMATTRRRCTTPRASGEGVLLAWPANVTATARATAAVAAAVGKGARNPGTGYRNLRRSRYFIDSLVAPAIAARGLGSSLPALPMSQQLTTAYAAASPAASLHTAGTGACLY
eukprot:COSAG05_NODE_2747_length_2692_cov_3.072889_2_plen_350_part_00